MHSRIVEVEGQPVTLLFGHEGVLYKSSFIMYDKRTDSKWNHSTGLAMIGPLSGTRLRILASSVVRWKTWRSLYPETLVLAREGRWGFMGTYLGEKQPEVLGLSVGQGPKAKLYPFSRLLQELVINDSVGSQSIVVTIDPSTKEAVSFSRKVRDRTLTFQPLQKRENNVPLMTDLETKTLWHRLTGRAIEGSLKGTEMMPLISVPWLQERWHQIYRDGILYQGPGTS